MKCECAKLEWKPEHYSLDHHPDCEGEKVYCLTPQNPLARISKVFVDGVEQKRCFAAYIRAESFTIPSYGKIIAGFQLNGKDLYGPMCTPELVLKHSIFDCDGVMCHFVEGKVFVEVEDDDALHAFFKQNS